MTADAVIRQGRACVQCSVCGARCLRPSQKACSETCRKERNRRRTEDSNRREHDAKYGPRPCRECGTDFKPTYGRTKTYCSADCERRYTNRVSRQAYGSTHRKRAKRAGVAYEPVNRTKVFERDGWKCGLCGLPTKRDKRGTLHPLAPELDHIIPLSKGGPHTYANVQCAHRQCNNQKGDAVEGQLLLIGEPLVAMCA